MLLLGDLSKHSTRGNVWVCIMTEMGVPMYMYIKSLRYFDLQLVEIEKLKRTITIL